ncbi:MAG: potassium transporter TrkG [Bacilli bacterium]
MDEVKDKPVVGFKLVIGYLGILLMILGVIILLPMLTFLAYPEEAADNWYAFFGPGMGFIIIGFLLFLFIFKKEKGRLAKYEDTILVLLTWSFIYLGGAIPLLFLKEFNFDYTKALFEATSGFTTTGFSAIANYEAVPKVFFIYRSLTHFVGGVGLVLILTSAISDRHNMRLYTADGHNDRLLPNIVKSARIIFSIYISYIIIGSLCLFAVGYNDGMTYFEAFNYSISCVSTGGLGLTANSIGTYNNVGIEIITSLLMLLGATSFLVNLYLIKGKYKKVFLHSETKMMIAFLVILIPISTLLVANYNYFQNPTVSYSDIFRVTAYTMVSSITTTGVSNASIVDARGIATLGTPFLALIGILVAIGTEAGSTGGGIKMNRTICVIKGIWFAFVDGLANKRRIKTHYIYKYDQKEVFEHSSFIAAVTFTMIYFALIFIFAMTFAMISKASFGYCTFDAIQSLSNSGLSIGLLGPTSSGGMMITSTIAMMLGRVEILPVLIIPLYIVKKIQRKAF